MRDEGTLNEYQAQWFRETKPAEELFDCEKDSHELHNLAEDPEYADKLKELRSECERWLQEIGDIANLPEQELIVQLWEGHEEQPSTMDPKVMHSEDKVVLSCSTEGASIGYKIIKDDAEPPSWRVYTEPINVEPESTIKVVAHRIGYKKSEVVETDRSP